MAAIEGAKPLDPDELPDREPQAAGPHQGSRAGQRPAETAAQDPREGDRRRRAADRPLRRTGSAGGWGAQEPQYSRGLALTNSSARTRVDLVEGRLAFAIEHGKLKMSRVAVKETVDGLSGFADHPAIRQAHGGSSARRAGRARRWHSDRSPRPPAPRSNSRGAAARS